MEYGYGMSNQTAIEALRDHPAIPAAVLPAVRPFVDIVNTIEEAGDSFIHEPTTFLHGVQVRTEAAIEEQGAEAFLEALLAGHRVLYDHFGADAFVDAMEEMLRVNACGVLKQQAAEDPRYSLLMKLAKKAHERIPFSPVMAFTVVSFEEMNNALMCSAGPLHEVVEAEPGERRARRLKDALHDVLETTYEPYLKGVIMLCDVIAGRPPVVPNASLGVLVDQASAAINRVGGVAEYPGLVDPDAGWLRNATSHRSHEYWRYLPGSDSLVVRDKNRAPETFTVEDLGGRAVSLWELSGPTFTRVAQLFMIRDFWVGSGIARELLTALRHVVGDDEVEARRAMADHDALGDMVFEPLLAWRAQHQVT